MMTAPSGTTTTVRVDRSDGTATEVVWRDLGDVAITRIGRDGEPVERYEIDLPSTGDVSVRRARAGGAAEPIEPTATDGVTNPFGTTVERHEYDGVVTVSHTFDDEGRFRSVSVEGNWGHHDLEIRPDGRRRLTWSSTAHRGEATWDASGRLTRYEAIFPDGTSQRWELVDETGRETITGWDGATTQRTGATPPLADLAIR